ncbi:uncharacterized protein RJT20DRAFT_1983 [Scheffersomyces xylosifermentans]|uniref:uncharacterized protein n=1 Tax=Scheffersomyces xylosifermentans TaxID=1304137 RepID=UPI00315CF869
MTPHRNGTATIGDDEDLLTPVYDHTKGKLDVTSIDLIRSSPYYEKDHWLDLTRSTDAYKVIGLALQSFKPTTEKYAFDPYLEAFNISVIIKLVKDYAKQLQIKFPKTHVYIIAFRSILFEHVQTSAEKRQFLATVDKDSHKEANESGGLLKYWFGTPDDVHGQNLATCWWESKKHAQVGGAGKAHRKGMNAVKSWFEHWKVEEYELIIEEDVSAYSFNRVV